MPIQPSIDDLPSFLATARENGWDPRPVLLRVQTDLFCNAPARGPDIVASYRSIAEVMIPVVDDETALIVAQKIAGLPETPHVLREALIARGGGAASACIALTPAIDSNWAELVAEGGDEAEAAGLAARTDLDPGLIAPLLARTMPDVDLVLACNHSIELPPDLRSILIERSRQNERLSRALLQRQDLSVRERAVFYARLDRIGRQRLREALENQPGPGTTTRMLPLLRDEDVVRLVSAARSRDSELFQLELASVSSLETGQIAALLADRSGELLALLLVGLGIEPEDGGIIFISGDDDIAHSVDAVFGLVALMRTIARSTAETIVAATCGLDPTRSLRSARHVPAMDAAISYPTDSSRRQDERSDAAATTATERMSSAFQRFMGQRRA